MALGRCVPVLLLVATLSGCAAPTSALLPDLGGWEQRNDVLAGLDAWEFSGRIAVRTGDDGFNGKLRYLHSGDGFQATLSGPLGAGTVRIEGSGPRVVLTDADGQRVEMLDAELDLRRRYGWTIPVASLRYWALGIPDPSTPADTQLNAGGQLASLRQGDWSVAVTRYRDGGGQLMPSRLNAENADTRVRLVIDRWVFHPQR